MITLPSCNCAFFIVVPSSYLSSMPSVLLNGSREGGGCRMIQVGGQYSCMAPASSVLFDGVIPIINNSKTWARQLLTISTPSGTPLSITFIFMPRTSVNGTRIPFTGVSGIEVVMFNCPSRYHAITIVVKGNNEGILEHFSIANYTSCDHLIRICTANTFHTSSNEIIIEFNGMQGVPVYLLYLAEVTFYSSKDNHCTVGPNTSSTTPKRNSTSKITTTNTSMLMYMEFRKYCFNYEISLLFLYYDRI